MTTSVLLGSLCPTVDPLCCKGGVQERQFVYDIQKINEKCSRYPLHVKVLQNGDISEDVFVGYISQLQRHHIWLARSL